MHGGEGIMRVDLTTRISQEEVQPVIKLKNFVQVKFLISFSPFEVCSKLKLYLISKLSW